MSLFKLKCIYYTILYTCGDNGVTGRQMKIPVKINTLRRLSIKHH